mmetsp:Transcript_6942/g.12944  ORF Transcript_6942/g.12944 Transcript_6942/m.12944 type:complete len:231 (+) Transcript_6942:336-1028(+)
MCLMPSILSSLLLLPLRHFQLTANFPPLLSDGSDAKNEFTASSAVVLMRSIFVKQEWVNGRTRFVNLVFCTPVSRVSRMTLVRRAETLTFGSLERSIVMALPSMLLVTNLSPPAVLSPWLSLGFSCPAPPCIFGFEGFCCLKARNSASKSSATEPGSHFDEVPVSSSFSSRSLIWATESLGYISSATAVSQQETSMAAFFSFVSSHVISITGPPGVTFAQGLLPHFPRLG